MTTAILVTTYNRPESLARSLHQIVSLGAPVLVVDDGTPIGAGLASMQKLVIFDCGAELLRLPSNRGLACALNIGLSYLLADKSIEWISYFQDDVDVHPKCLSELAQFQKHNHPIMTGHDAGEHAAHNEQVYFATPIKWKWSIRATHVHAHRDWWLSQLPFPTNELGTPKRKGSGRGMGSNVDWYFCRDGANSCQKTKTPIICVPGLVRTFSLKAEDSCWNNAQKEEPPLRSDL